MTTQNASENTAFQTDADADEKLSRPLLAQILIYLGLCISIGCGAVLISKTIEEGFELVPSLVIGSIIIASLAMMVIGVKIGNFDTPSLSSKTGRAQLVLVLSAGMGAVISVYLIFSGAMDRFIEGDFTISQIEAIVALTVLVAVLMPMAYIRERNADDFEKAAAKEAAYWSFYAYLYAYLGWSIAAAGSLAPALNSGYLFLFLLFLFLGIWAFKRSG